MPVTPRIWAKQKHSSALDAAQAFARWLVNTTKLWTIIEAFSSASVDQRRTPTVTATDDMDNALFSADGDFGWQTGTIVAGDWIVLQSTAPGMRVQVYLEADSTSIWKWAMMPDADFATGGTDVTPPNTPQGFPASTAIAGGAVATTIGGSPTLVSQTTSAQSGWYSACVDSSTIVTWFTSNVLTTPSWMYVGAFLSNPSDTKPFTIMDTPNTCRADTGSARWNRISAMDGITGLLTGIEMARRWTSTEPLATTGLAMTLGGYRVDPLFLYWSTVGHKLSGACKYVGMATEDLASSGAFSGRDFVWTSDTQTEAKLVFCWDGETEFP